MHPLGSLIGFYYGSLIAVGMTWCVEHDRNNSFEVAIRTSFFDDGAESLGKKRLVVDVVDELGYTR